MSADLGRSGWPGRRRFLLFGALALAAGGGGAVAVAEALGRRHSPQAGPSSPGRGPRQPTPVPAGTSPVADHRPPSAADWAGLRGELSAGRLVLPEDSGYDGARLLFDPKFDSIRPAAVAYCAVPGEVSACLAFARKFSVPLAVRSGGHSYGGWSTTAGLVVDVTRMSRVSVDVGARTARVGAGTLLIDLYDRLSAYGLAVPGGSCPTVGVAGLALGGGVGVFGRLFGLTCDNVIGVEIVTADGVVRECSADVESDLFWACRGGGGGSFGVVTAFTFRTYPAPDLVLFYLTWPWSQAAAVISAWQSWAPVAPDQLWSNLHLTATAGGSQPVVSVGGT